MTTIKNKAEAALACIWCLVSGLHRDERGDNENLGRMLILALILIPLVILLATFGGQIYTSAEKAWKNVMTKEVGK